MRITAERYHDFSCGHRVVGHEGKCALLHGHNYRVFFTCSAPSLDSVGRVIDFSVIKETLCEYLENNWDHRFLAWSEDPQMLALWDASLADPSGQLKALVNAIVWVSFNPTAENIGSYLLNVIGPRLLEGTGVELISVRIEETRKCSAVVSLY